MVDIKITTGELDDPTIDEIINLEKSLQRSEGEFVEEIPTPFYLNPIFYYGIASFLGSFVVWAIAEQSFSDSDISSIPLLSDYLLFGPAAGAIGLAIGAMYGISNHNLKNACYCGLVGAGVGLGATILTNFLASILFGISKIVAITMTDNIEQIPEGEFPFRGVAFAFFMCGRGLAWAVVSMGAGLGLG